MWEGIASPKMICSTRALLNECTGQKNFPRILFERALQPAVHVKGAMQKARKALALFIRESTSFLSPLFFFTSS